MAQALHSTLIVRVSLASAHSIRSLARLYVIASPEGPGYDWKGSPKGLDYDREGSPKGLDYDREGSPKGLDYDRQWQA